MTIEELLQIEAIRQLRVLYSHNFDGKRLAELVDLFTDDAVCEFGPEYGGDWVGKLQIRANYAKYLESEGPEFGVLHAVTNHNVTLVDASTALGGGLIWRTTSGKTPCFVDRVDTANEGQLRAQFAIPHSVWTIAVLGRYDLSQHRLFDTGER